MLESIMSVVMQAKIPTSLIAIGGGLSVVVIWIIAATVDSVLKTRAREAIRREIAAYVAEGSMTPDDGARLLEAGRKHKSAGL